MSEKTGRTLLVLSFHQISKDYLPLVGGKAANLGALSGIKTVKVPKGFCITTVAYERMVNKNALLPPMLDQLSQLNLKEQKQISEVSAKIRRVIENFEIPGDVEEEITQQLTLLGKDNAFAIRSSATAEDLPTASFAGQLDSFLNIKGSAPILHHIRKCWASLFTERAITYRIQNGFDHRRVQMAVVVQWMVPARVSGVLFTADPLSSHREILSIDAVAGLGEALVSGKVIPEHYRVQRERIIHQTATRTPLLDDNQILSLGRLGREIESHLGSPQDIEWCESDGDFYIVQSRPITTLYPLPEVHDQKAHVYVSVGHQQMMTDPMKPLGWSFFQMTALRPMFQAGGRLFVDIAEGLATPATRTILLQVLGTDPLIRGALVTLLKKGALIKLTDMEKEALDVPGTKQAAPMPVLPPGIQNDTAIVRELIERTRRSVATCAKGIQSKSGPELFDFIREDIEVTKKLIADPQSTAVLMAGIHASAWINENIYDWTGEKGAADTLSQSVPYNVTSEMGLALLDVADRIRPYPRVVDYLQKANSDNFLEGLSEWEG
ncbi:MAG: phosphoenolpyruvate synthase, partial [Bacteroidota bacterium]|nr:phosphoenolpyruvate synthase [Bacteroidota bacterium]